MTYNASELPAGLTLNSSKGASSGTAVVEAAAPEPDCVIVRDKDGTSSTGQSITWSGPTPPD